MPPLDSRSRIVLVEDHPMFRERLASLINAEADMAVCGETDNVRDAVHLLTEARADLAIIDISLKESSGVELLKDLAAAHVKIPVLVLSMHDESLYAERVLRLGARGYITKQRTSSQIMVAIRQVLSGEIYVSPQIASRIVRKFSEKPVAEPGLVQLTDRELQVFELIGQGLSTRQISARLRLGMTTVDTYRARIKTKLQLASATELSQEAIRWVEQGQMAV